MPSAAISPRRRGEDDARMIVFSCRHTEVFLCEYGIPSGIGRLRTILAVTDWAVAVQRGCHMPRTHAARRGLPIGGPFSFGSGVAAHFQVLGLSGKALDV